MYFRYTFLISILLLCFCAVNGQTLGDLKFQLPPLIDRYKMDFEIEGIMVPTEETLSGVDLDQYEELRQADTDTEIYDEATGYHIILYSVNKSIKNYTSGLKKRGDED